MGWVVIRAERGGERENGKEGAGEPRRGDSHTTKGVRKKPIFGRERVTDAGVLATCAAERAGEKETRRGRSRAQSSVRLWSRVQSSVRLWSRVHAAVTWF